jgi:phage tail-like protein
MNDYRGISAPFLFQVELDGLYVGGFTEVTGLQVETELMEYSEGGVNDFVHYFPKQTKYPRIVLKRGITRTPDLWEWYESVLTGKIKRKTGTIILYHSDVYEICRWNFLESYPVKWIGPDMNSTSSSVAIESLEIVHSGLKTVFSKING